MVNLADLLTVLRTEPHRWAPGSFDTAQRHQFYLQAADEIERLTNLLDHAKTAALIDVAESAAAQGDWAVAQAILRYRATPQGEIPTLDPARDLLIL